MEEENRKYYWLRLQRDFFKRHDIKIIENMMNGKDYILFYLKLLCESVDHNGNLRFSDKIPYNEEMLSIVTGTSIDTVKSAIQVFSNLNMIEILDDGTYYMSEVKKMIGSETKWAEKKRQYREKQKQIQQSDAFPSIEEKTYQGRTIKEGEVDSVVNSFNEICKSYKNVAQLNSTVINDVVDTLSTHTTSDLKRAFEKAEESDFLKGNSDSKWKASFNWIVKKENIEKILNGNYDSNKDFKTKKQDIQIEAPTDYEEANKSALKDVCESISNIGI